MKIQKKNQEKQIPTTEKENLPTPTTVIHKLIQNQTGKPKIYDTLNPEAQTPDEFRNEESKKDDIAATRTRIDREYLSPETNTKDYMGTKPITKKPT